MVFVFFCHAPSPEHRACEGCIVRTSIVLPFIARFRRGFQRFFRKGLNFQTHYIVLILVGRWRHKFREMADVDVHLYKTFAARSNLALTASVNIRKSSPKTARNEQVCAHQKSYRK